MTEPHDASLTFHPLSPRANAWWMLCAVACFHLAQEMSFCVPLLVVFFISLLQLARQASARVTIYLGLVVGLCVYGPPLFFFWSIFHQGALVLWLILGSWLALYLLLQRMAWLRSGPLWGTMSAPVLWMALEYFRSELYFLRFSWLSAGYSLPTLSRWTGLYGVGFALMLVSALGVVAWTRPRWRLATIIVSAMIVPLSFIPRYTPSAPSLLKIAGVQREEASDATVLRALDELDVKYPDTPLFVLSEYSFDSPVPPEIKAWCAQHRRWLIVGGKAFVDATQTQFRDTVFVISPEGKEVFAQGKSRPIQFFDDGLPALRQAVWNSPWGKIGLCVCYDLSYSRVTDELIRQGARAIIVPTMDVEAWGGREHALHAKVAPARAAEYGVPVFRLASSGISQAVDTDGVVVAKAPFPGQGQMLAATLALPANGRRVPIDRLLVWPCMAGVVLLLGWQLAAWVRGIAWSASRLAKTGEIASETSGSP